MVEGCLIRDKTIVILAEKHPQLHTLLASACVQLTDSSLVALGRNCPKLYALNIRGNPFGRVIQRIFSNVLYLSLTAK
jgi:hypothetical protein